MGKTTMWKIIKKKDTDEIFDLKVDMDWIKQEVYKIKSAISEKEAEASYKSKKMWNLIENHINVFDKNLEIDEEKSTSNYIVVRECEPDKMPSIFSALGGR